MVLLYVWLNKRSLSELTCPQSLKFYKFSEHCCESIWTKPCVLFCVYHTKSEQIEMNLKMMEGKYTGRVVESH